jgi:hypothetical protein
MPGLTSFFRDPLYSNSLYSVIVAVIAGWMMLSKKTWQ